MNEVFQIPTFVINLDESVERYQEVLPQLQKLSINAERISAVRGSKLSEQEFNRVYDEIANKKLFRRGLTAGEVGCYLSHRKIWQRMLDQNIKLALVLEDDIVINDNILDFQKHVDTLVKYDVVKLADDRNCPPAESKKLDEQHSLISYSNIPNCTTGYFVSLAGAKKLLARKRIYRPVDIDMQHCYELGVSVVGVTPYPLDKNMKWDVDEMSDIAIDNGGAHSVKTDSYWRNVKYRIRLAWYRKFYRSAHLN
ncbi:glycosyltransferase family 25 protein [Endozoicomonas sp. G2_1]|uniref:glycosyltransferase family 25 protein n=1 Tax=Endozoicomonas sp. G2_1 TaxID=2821091 RepID=UPI001ADA81DE|nr:glycosyltransferase family 25 protein [Endozoicomonas sp. G2_1]